MAAAYRLSVCLLLVAGGACGSRTSPGSGGGPLCLVGCAPSCEPIAWTLELDRAELTPVGDRLVELRVGGASGVSATARDLRGRSLSEFEIAWPGPSLARVGRDTTGALAASRELSLWLANGDALDDAISRVHTDRGERSTATHPWTVPPAPVGERYGAYGFSVTARSAAFYEWLSTDLRADEVTLVALVEAGGEWGVDFQRRVPINGWACGLPPLPAADGWMISCLRPAGAEARPLHWELIRVTRDEARTDARYDLAALGIAPDLHTHTGSFVTTQQSSLVGSDPTVAANVNVGGRRGVVLLRRFGDEVESTVLEEFDPEHHVHHVTASTFLGVDGVAVAYTVTSPGAPPHLRLAVVRHSSGETAAMWDLPLEGGRVESVSVALGVESTTAVVHQRLEVDAPSRATVLSACHRLGR